MLRITNYMKMESSPKRKRLRREQTSQKGNVSLITALMEGNLELAKTIIKIPTNDINECDDEGKTVLMKLTELKSHDIGHYEIVQLLLQTKNVQINKQDNQGRTALILSARVAKADQLRIAILTTILNNIQCDPDIQDFEGKSTLWYASENGLYELVEILLKDDRCDVNQFNLKTNETLLMNTVDSHSKETLKIVNLFLKHPKIEINARNNAQETVLMIGARSMSSHAAKIVKMLLKHHASVADRDEKGMSALMYACESESVHALEIVKSLLKYRASVFDRDGEDTTPLNVCC